MGILTAVGVPIYQDYVISSKENTAKDNLQSIAFMQGDYRSESNQYFPCPKKTLSTTQIDKQFFGGKGKLSSGDYSYKMTGGCSGFIASALISNSKAKCFKIDQNRIISTITCPNEGSSTDYEIAVKLAKNESCNLNEIHRVVLIWSGKSCTGGNMACKLRDNPKTRNCYRVHTGSSIPMNGVYTKELTPQNRELYNRILNPNCKYPCTADGKKPLNNSAFCSTSGRDYHGRPCGKGWGRDSNGAWTGKRVK
jgi:type IV pilus assembly protein PilE